MEIVKDKNKSGGMSPLFHIAGLGAAVAFGAMVASLFALNPAANGVTFQLNAATIISPLVATPFAWFYWRLMARMAVEKTPQQRKRKFIVFSVGLMLVGLVSFLYPLKFIPAEKRQDVFIGLALAVGCITGVGFVMWKVKRFLDADLKSSQEQENSEDRRP